jgi:hypothetical protein
VARNCRSSISGGSTTDHTQRPFASWMVMRLGGPSCISNERQSTLGCTGRLISTGAAVVGSAELDVRAVRASTVRVGEGGASSAGGAGVSARLQAVVSVNAAVSSATAVMRESCIIQSRVADVPVATGIALAPVPRTGTSLLPDRLDSLPVGRTRGIGRSGASLSDQRAPADRQGATPVRDSTSTQRSTRRMYQGVFWRSASS